MPSLNDLLARGNPSQGQEAESPSGSPFAGLGGILSGAMTPFVSAARVITSSTDALRDKIGALTAVVASVAPAGGPAPLVPGRPTGPGAAPTASSPAPPVAPQGGQGVAGAVGGLGSIISGALSPLVGATTSLRDKIISLTLVVGQLIAMGGIAPTAAPAKEDIPTAKLAPKAPQAPAPKGGKGGGGISIPNITGLITSNPVVAAVAAVPAALGTLVAAIRPFVGAFNPSIVLAFDQSMANISATIGSSVAPMLQIFTSALRRVNDMIAPTFERLAPVIEGFANHLVGILMPALDLFLQLGKALMPVITVAMELQKAIDSVFRGLLSVLGGTIGVMATNLRVLVAILQPVIANLRILGALVEGVGQVLGTISRIFGAAMEGFIDVLGALLEPLIGELPSLETILGGIARAAKAVTENLVLFAANLFSIIGFTSGLKALKKAFTPDVGQGKRAAPKDFQLTGIEEAFKKNILLAAQAIGGKETKDVGDEASKLNEKIQKIIEQGPSFGNQLKDIITALQRIADKLPDKDALKRDAGRMLSGNAGVLGLLHQLGIL